MGLFLLIFSAGTLRLVNFLRNLLNLFKMLLTCIAMATGA